VVAYCRVSTSEQAAEGISLDAQHHRLRAYAEAHGLNIVRYEADEGVSGKRADNRPALQRALASLADGTTDGLAVVKLDRLTRSIRDVIDLVERSDRGGWRLISIAESLDTQTAIGRFTVHLLGALAQLEREQVGERTRAAMAELRRQGRRCSRFPPFGHRFDSDNRVVQVAAEQEVLQRMLKLEAEGAGCYRIATVLNADGTYNPRTGRPWFYGTLRSIIESARKARPA